MRTGSAAAGRLATRPSRPGTICSSSSKNITPSLLEKPTETLQLRKPPVLRAPQPPLPPPSAAALKRPRLGSMQCGSAAAVHRGRKITLAIVGDVHSQWTADDEAALASLQADVAVFVGDFGEEQVALVQRIATLQHPKAVMLGNHDAWFSLTPSGRWRYTRAMLASSSLAVRDEFSEGGSTPAIMAQLQALGAEHIGYGSKRFPALGLTLLGARPFSKGGRQWSDVAEFYEEHYGIGSMQDSALRVLDLALAAEEGDCKVVVAHNGPAGLGGRRHSICGVDWTQPEADFGDPDLQEALDMMYSQGLHVPLVVFGHMHSQLAGGGWRNMVEVDAVHGTVYLNTAAVPRIRSFPVAPCSQDGPSACSGSGGSGSSGSSSSMDGSGAKMQGHHFVLVELRQQVVTGARDVWVGVQHSAHASSSSGGSGGDSGSRCVMLHEQELLRTSFPLAAEVDPGAAAAAVVAATAQSAEEEALEEDECSYICSVYRAHTGEWEPVVMQAPASVQPAVAC